MSSHVSGIAKGFFAGVSKVVELGRQAAIEFRNSPKAVGLGFVVGLLAALMLKVIF